MFAFGRNLLKLHARFESFFAFMHRHFAGVSLMQTFRDKARIFFCIRLHSG
jgi:hypothetical protein